MNRSIGSFLKPFSKSEVVNVKLMRKGSTSCKDIILMFIKRKNWETIGKEYKAMGEINMELSEFGFFSVFEELVKYERRLSESDSLNDYDGSKKRGHILC